jgi:predicted homoserine dehydrogenase-like protein
LIFLDIPLTIREVLRGEGVLLNNSSSPTASVCTIAKKVLEPGTMIQRENRHFFVRGEAIQILEIPNHVPIGLMYDVVLKQKVEPGQILTFDDIELNETLAVRAWEYTRDLANNTTLGVTRKSR